ncbi:hypothetical protein PCANB_000112 [Pneumocystis canis]|nr:hypothetical protein PCK1_000043 [Pneumocystis canis]KAG5439830.1 hypothetical protein PCANB_000112 [Pneumocystis canis]
MGLLDKNLILFVDSCFEEELYQSGLEILDVVLIPKNDENFKFIPSLPEKYLFLLLNLIVQKDYTNHISQRAAMLLNRIIYSKKSSKNELNEQWFWMFCHHGRSQRFKLLINNTNIDESDIHNNLKLNFKESIFSKFSDIWELIQHCFEELSPELYILLNFIVFILEIDWKEYSREDSKKELEKTLLMNSFKSNDREKPDIKQVLIAIFANIDLENYEYPLSLSNITESSNKKKIFKIKSIESMMLRKRLLHLVYNAISALPKNFNKFDFENELSIYFKNLEINKFIFYFSNTIPSSLKINLCHLLLVKYSIHSKLSKHFSELSIDLLKLWLSSVPQAKLGLSEKAKYSFLLQTLLKQIYNDLLSKKITKEEKQAIYIAKINRTNRFNEEIKKIGKKGITQNDLDIQNIFEHSEYIINHILDKISQD